MNGVASSIVSNATLIMHHDACQGCSTKDSERVCSTAAEPLPSRRSRCRPLPKENISKLICCNLDKPASTTLALAPSWRCYGQLSSKKSSRRRACRLCAIAHRPCNWSTPTETHLRPPGQSRKPPCPKSALRISSFTPDGFYYVADVLLSPWPFSPAQYK